MPDIAMARREGERKVAFTFTVLSARSCIRKSESVVLVLVLVLLVLVVLLVLLVLLVVE